MHGNQTKNQFVRTFSLFEFFFADVIFANGMPLKIKMFCVVVFFAVKQQLVPGINYFRK